MAKSEHTTKWPINVSFPVLLGSSPRENPLIEGAGLCKVRQKRERTGTTFLYIIYIKI